MSGLWHKIFGASSEKEVRKLWKYVEQVNVLEPEIAKLPDDAFRIKTGQLKEKLSHGHSVDEILPEAFALVREAARRTVEMRPFDVQVLGGVVLHQGRIAEMKTGEGKTLVATMPAYLNALTGKGVHIVTVNDYLARRDSEWMGPVYRLLGLTVGLVIHDLSPAERRRAYQSDIVYATNNELGFDYLRDNMVIYQDELVQREHYYAIVDEVDSILIDEARTPLIISSRVESKEEYSSWKSVAESLIRKQSRMINDLLARANESLEQGLREEAAELLLLVRRGAPKNKKLHKLLKGQGMDKLVERTKQILVTDKKIVQFDEQLFFTIDEVTRNVDISQMGHREMVRNNLEISRLLGFEQRAGGGAEPEGQEEDRRSGEHLHYIRQLLKAYSLYEKDVDYVLQDGKVIIVDEFTGRLMWGRRYSEGLHQAIEAKEGVQVQADTRTVASITFQNYFRMYSKLAGMTGTAVTEEEEFRKIYGMDVVEIPTNKTLIRQELDDVIYKTERAKFTAVVEEIKRRFETGQPVLVGTVTVEKSEMLSKMLKRQGVPHEVLNAVNHNREAYIIAQAGSRGAVTISTNMAGRGTDIILGGNPEYLVKERLEKQYGKSEGELNEEEQIRFREQFATLLQEARREMPQKREEVLASGGLHVLGTERHESRRIDNQLRGRSGRQGDPGSSQFFVSLEDDLMRLFGGDNIASLMDRFGMSEDVPIDHPLIGKAIERAQKKVEARNFEIRKHLLDYDDVLNKQREVIYRQRRQVLQGEEMREPIAEMVAEVIERTLQDILSDKKYLEESDSKALIQHGEGSFLRRGKIKTDHLIDRDRGDVRRLLLDESADFYRQREQELGAEIIRELERVVLLRTVDHHWMYFIDEMHELRQNINLRAYAQRDPLVEYRLESFDMFEGMIRTIQDEVVRAVYQVKVASRPQRQAVAGSPVGIKPRAAVTAGGGIEAPVSPSGSGKARPITSDKIGRNEPCSCGSGKKYKKCCGK